MKPMLWRFPAYCEPGLPSPAMIFMEHVRVLPDDAVVTTPKSVGCQSFYEFMETLKGVQGLTSL
jgi:hypothetical protein